MYNIFMQYFKEQYQKKILEIYVDRVQIKTLKHIGLTDRLLEDRYLLNLQVSEDILDEL